MKKGLFSILAGALLVVGCQNYDDQFTNIETQILALANQVAGLSKVQSDLTALAGTVNSLQTSVDETIDSALADGLADIDAAVASLEAATATAASSEDVAAIAQSVQDNQDDLTELLANSAVFNGNVTINSVATLNAFHSMGGALQIVNGNVVMTVGTDMDMVKVQEVADVMLTITGDLTYTSAAGTIAEAVFNNLSGTSTLTLEQGGGYHFPLLVSASKIKLSDKFESTITRVNFPALTSVVSIGTDSYTGGVVEFTKATAMNFAALATYGGSLTFKTKKGKLDDVVTLDISALVDQNSLGTQAALTLSISGPNTVTVSTIDGKGGSLTLQNVLSATVTDYDGSIVVNGGVETFTSNNVVALSGTMSDVITVNVTGVLDPNNTTGASADKSGPAIDFDARADLITATLAGNFASVDVQNNGNLETLTITADVNNGDIDIDNNSDLETITLTGAKASGVIINANNSLVTVTVDATMQKVLLATAKLDGSIKVTNNTDLESLTITAASVSVLTVTGNVDLETINGTGLTSLGATAASNNVTISGNKFSASVAQDLANATATTAALGANLLAGDLGSFTTTSGMSTMKVYLGLVEANASSTASAYWDTVESTTNALGIETTSETTGSSDVTAILVKTAGTAAVTTGANSAVKQKRAFLVDISAASNGIALTVDTVEVLHNGTGYGIVTMTGNASIDLVAIKASLATTRATTLGVTLDATVSGNSVAPTITFLATTASNTGANGENYTNAQVGAIGNATNNSFITTYDGFTVGVGNLSVTATLVDAAATPYAVASGTTTVGITALAARIATVWNAKYGAAGTSSTLSIWGNMTASSGAITIAAKASSRGSRGFGDIVTVAWAKAAIGTVSAVTAGTMSTAATYLAGHSMDWKIGATEASTDNAAVGTDIIITLLEGTNSIDAATRQATMTYHAAASVGGVELFNTSFPNAASGAGTATSTAANIYPLQARLDVINGESANEGIVTTAAVLAVAKTRVHWL